VLPPDEAADLARALDAASGADAAGPSDGIDALAPLMPLLRSLFGAQACSVAVVDGEELRFVAADGGAGVALIGQSIPAGQGIAGWAVLSGTAVAVAEVQADPRFARDFAESVGYLPGEILAAPMRSGDTVIGVMEVLDPARRFEDRGRDLEVLESLAAYAGALWAAAEAASAPVRAFLQALSADQARIGQALTPDADLARLAADLRAVSSAPGGADLAHQILRTIAGHLATGHRE
jgi:GAF domain-containing protein